ncbi:SCO1431 family membrane protein [Streptomyces abyssomicinicus]|nr:SCO1431 family membrane protein [Streptomyces abyssomicinicus]
MSAATATLTRTLTGGPKDDDDNNLVEHIAGWVLVVVMAMLVTRLGLV